MENLLDRIPTLADDGYGRRSHCRYPINLEIRCKALRSDRVLFGRIRDISSNGVFFNSSELLPPGTHVEFAIDWPALLANGCVLELHGQGGIIRSDEHGTAIKMERHKFSTRRAD
jgi:PilZ domain